MKVPGILYSIVLALAAWALDYFGSSGAGGDFIWAPLLLAAVPIVVKFFTVATEPEPEPVEGTARSMGGPVVAGESKTRRLLLG
jgi:hypothetical protein